MKNTTDILEQKICSADTFEDFVMTNEEDTVNMTLDSYLEQLLQKYQMQRKEIIESADIDRVYGYQIFNGTRAKPSRNILLQIAFAFPLTIMETKHLLYYGHVESLYPRSKRDAYIMFALHQQYSLLEVNSYLEEHGLETLC